MGGKLRVLLCGSAPLSIETQNFIRCCLGIRVLQGYGLTETAACATAMHCKYKWRKVRASRVSNIVNFFFKPCTFTSDVCNVFNDAEN